MTECSWWEVGCNLGNWVESTVGDAIENMANAVVEAFGKAIASLGTVWVHIGTPNLTGTGGSSQLAAGDVAPASGATITTVMGYVTWISLAVAILSLFALGALVATRVRAGEGMAAVGRLGLILGAVVLLAAAGALVSGVLPAGPRNAGGAVLFLQSGLWWYMGAAAVVSVVIGAARMAWEQRAEPGRETVRSLLTLVVVAGAGVTIVSLLVAAADSFAVWILNSSLECDVTSDSACFGQSMLDILALTTNTAAGGLGALLVIILGLIAILGAAIQILLMVARGGMLVILTGILPLAASFTNTEIGRGWFKKCVAWLVAFILYKPAAAIVYAAAFQLVGTDVFSDDGTGLLAVLTGLMLMIIALFAMPALMRFVTPMVGAVASGAAGGAVAMGAMAALPTGAAAIGRLAARGGAAAVSAAGSDGPRGATGPGGSGGGSDTPGPSGSRSSGAPSPGGPHGSARGDGSAAAASSSGARGAPVGVGAQAGGGGTSAAAIGAKAGGGGSAAGVAAGPAGVATGAALEAGRRAGAAASGAARSVGEQATGEGEGEGPSGSR
ncbi:hypothetical protein SAMN05216184_11932 [Georgenia satyanarayanai]|uniref:TrbL/VirB6 plasmid conjugal transfer protein n=1 Tax=Georgenia satyanarayanai TaxID=860221 RepID=A0A2Y9AS48_9MICO|nr:hypothetical protein [Georgenia satyanarayanai]PYF96372.1 hypothetical protein A8987_11932 [Georgenia satyanarayanai]SSA46915.1 hypothetical protein SAMN05216184_11932 [Georgenia satyanarayanai]